MNRENKKLFLELKALKKLLLRLPQRKQKPYIDQQNNLVKNLTKR